jgi:hypothetical protein
MDSLLDKKDDNFNYQEPDWQGSFTRTFNLVNDQSNLNVYIFLRNHMFPWNHEDQFLGLCLFQT